MKTITWNTAQKMIREGRIEFVTDMKIGYCTIRWNVSKKTETVQIVASKAVTA